MTKRYACMAALLHCLQNKDTPSNTVARVLAIQMDASIGYLQKNPHLFNQMIEGWKVAYGEPNFHAINDWIQNGPAEEMDVEYTANSIGKN